MRCYLCGKGPEDGVISEGIFEGRIVHICSDCSREEHIPLIKHPAPEEFEHVERQRTVRERLENLSNSKRTVVSDQAVANKNLAKIKFPPKRQEDESLSENYDWKLSSARRRRKITLAQLSEMSGISEEDIDSLEHGQLVDNFKEKIMKLELFLDIDVIISEEKDEKFVYPNKTTEEEILENVKKKMGSEKKVKKIREKTEENRKSMTDEEEQEILAQAKRSYEEIQKKKIKEKKELNKKILEEKEEVITDIASGKFDFSKKNKIQNITLKDLQDMKKKKEKDKMMGKEVELEDFIDDADGDWS